MKFNLRLSYAGVHCSRFANYYRFRLYCDRRTGDRNAIERQGRARPARDVKSPDFVQMLSMRCRCVLLDEELWGCTDGLSVVENNCASSNENCVCLLFHFDAAQTPLESLVMGAVSKILSSLVTYPSQVSSHGAHDGYIFIVSFWIFFFPVCVGLLVDRASTFQ